MSSAITFSAVDRVKLPQGDPFLLGQEIVTPFHGREQSLLAFGRRAAAACQQFEATIQQPRELMKPEAGQAGRRQLDRERNTVEATANLAESKSIIFRGRKGSPNIAHPLEQHLNRRKGEQLVRAQRLLRGRYGQAGKPVDKLSRRP
jgi:hypothetical protein